MKFPSVHLAVLIALVFCVGCNNQANNPALWPQQTIETKLKTKYEFTEIQLTPDGEGKYNGIAKSKDGETLKITISQDPAAKKLKYDFKGDRGWIEDGLYELD